MRLHLLRRLWTQPVILRLPYHERHPRRYPGVKKATMA